MQIPYRHIPLEGSRSIRVLELQPALNAVASITCKLRTFSLDDYPQWDANYTALSYTWDGQTPTCEIECNGCVMLITPNCDVAIRSLRSATEIQVLWIDSICIDQSKEAVLERNGQVALMGEIYKSAVKVVIWLGQSNERVEAAIHQVTELAHIAQTANVGDRGAINHANRRATQHALRERVERISSSKLPLSAERNLPIDIDTGVNHASDDPFGPLFECSWFYRVWTLQECTLPFYQRMTLRCGMLEIPWANVVLVADLLKGAQYRWGRYEEAMSLQTRVFTYLICQRIEGARAVLNQNPGVLQNDPLMYSILEDVRMKQATNPKDKVIGMYGLLKELFFVCGRNLSGSDRRLNQIRSETSPSVSSTIGPTPRGFSFLGPGLGGVRIPSIRYEICCPWRSICSIGAWDVFMEDLTLSSKDIHCVRIANIHCLPSPSQVVGYSPFTVSGIDTGRSSRMEVLTGPQSADSSGQNC
jgi:hypothetical protein